MKPTDRYFPGSIPGVVLVWAAVMLLAGCQRPEPVEPAAAEVGGLHDHAHDHGERSAPRQQPEQALEEAEHPDDGMGNRERPVAGQPTRPRPHLPKPRMSDRNTTDRFKGTSPPL